MKARRLRLFVALALAGAVHFGGAFQSARGAEPPKSNNNGGGNGNVAGNGTAAKEEKGQSGVNPNGTAGENGQENGAGNGNDKNNSGGNANNAGNEKPDNPGKGNGKGNAPDKPERPKKDKETGPGKNSGDLKEEFRAQTEALQKKHKELVGQLKSANKEERTKIREQLVVIKENWKELNREFRDKLDDLRGKIDREGLKDERGSARPRK